MDLISVIIPVFNTEKYLDECIKSVINQTYSNIEILLIDDGSTDRSPYICDSYKDERIIVYHRKNEGLSSSRQFGIDKCNGKYFVTIDADDYILPKYIEILHNSIVSNQTNISVCERFDFNEKSKTRKYLKYKYDTVLKVNPNMLINDYCHICHICNLSDSWDKMYETNFVKKSGVKFKLEKQYNGNDLAFNHKLVLYCPKYSFIRVPLLMHRLSENSMVRRKNKPLEEGFEKIINQIQKEARLCGLPTNFNTQLIYLYEELLCYIFFDIIYYSTKPKKDIQQLFSQMNEFFIKNNLNYIEDKRNFPIIIKCVRKCFIYNNYKKATILMLIIKILRNIKHTALSIFKSL
mgnify:CR=1 FL=1